MSKLITLSAILSFFVNSFLFAGPVLCSNSSGSIYVKASLEGEGNLTGLEISNEGVVRKPIVNSGTYFNSGAGVHAAGVFSFSAIVDLPEENINFSLETTNNGMVPSVLSGFLKEQAGESTQEVPVTCVVVWPSQESADI